MAEIAHRFREPMLFVPLLDYEPKGIERLRALGRDMYEAG
jgi:hypothetical protein